jgi:hypothetical protein
MRTTFSMEIHKFGPSDTLLTQTPPEDGGEEMNKFFLLCVWDKATTMMTIRGR